MLNECLHTVRPFHDTITVRSPYGSHATLITTRWLAGDKRVVRAPKHGPGECTSADRVPAAA